MNDLISRQAAIAEFSCCELTPDGGIDANYAIDFLEQLPSVQELKAKWIHYYEGDFDYDYKCSNCGYAVWDDSDFCPNCGASMTEGVEDD